MSPSRTIRIGRESDNDFVVNLPMVSAHHARIIWEGQPGQAVIEDLGSSSGTAVGSPDLKITRSILFATDTIYLGTHAIPAADVLARVDPSLVPTLLFQGAELVIGRLKDCDRVLDLPMISGRHARLRRSGNRILIEDLGSLTGTFVNGQRILRDVEVRPGDLISLGEYKLRLAADAGLGLDQRTRPSAVAVSVPSAPGSIASVVPSHRPVSGPTRAGGAISKQFTRLLILLVQAPLVALVIVMILGTTLSSEATAARLHGLGLAALWFGLSNAVVGDLLDAQRIRDGRSPRGAASLGFRVSILVLLGIGQSFLAWAILSTLTNLKSPWLPAIGLLVAASMVGTALGLLIVVLAPRRWVSWTMLPLIMLLLAVFGDMQRPLSRKDTWAGSIANVLPPRWVFEGLVLQESGSVRSPIPAGEEGLAPGRVSDFAEEYFPAGTQRMGPRADLIALTLMAVGLTALAGFISRERGRAL
jgi:pSer/pThr/pTyr-binding forkhead associated (FHA) protein